MTHSPLSNGRRSGGSKFFIALSALAMLSLSACPAAPDAVTGEGEVRAVSAAVIAQPSCELLATAGNGELNAEILDTLNRSIAGTNIDLPGWAIGIGIAFRLHGVTQVSFDGCKMRFRIDTTLRRQARHDARGVFDVKGTLYAAKQRIFFEDRPELPPIEVQLACLRDAETERFELNRTTELTENLIEMVADRQEGQCFPAGALWSDLEAGIGFLRAFDPSFPPLELEQKPDRTELCNGRCPPRPKHDEEKADFFRYSMFGSQVATALHEIGDEWELEIADNDDLFAIKKRGTGTGATEVHVLSAASNYQSFSLQTGTGLGEVGNNVEFALLPNRDLVVLIKSGTGTRSTEVHILSAASNYADFVLHTGTALGETGDNVELEVARNGDLYAIFKNTTGSGMTEVHVLTAESGYQSFSVHAATALHETGDSFEFVITRNGDLVAISKNNTGSGMTEVHILDAATNYSTFIMQVPTALGQSDDRFDFLWAVDRDLVAIVKSGGSSGMTQLHRLMR